VADVALIVMIQVASGALSVKAFPKNLIGFAVNGEL
jgi:hypothetical protein